MGLQRIDCVIDAALSIAAQAAGTCNATVMNRSRPLEQLRDACISYYCAAYLI